MADIELMIKIPEEMYQKIKETNMIIGGRRNGKRFDYILFNAVNTGIPLPKGHGRLIDADALEDYIKEDADEWDKYALVYIKDAPTIIEADKAESGNNK